MSGGRAPRGPISALLLGTLALLLAAGCSERPLPQTFPEDTARRYADLICPAALDCGCGLFASIEECRQLVFQRFEEFEPGLREFDEDCFEQHLASSIFESCGPSTDWDQIPSCVGVRGGSGLGEPCQQFQLFGVLAFHGSCAGDAVCNPWSGTCEEAFGLLPGKELGSPCTDTLPRNCSDGDLYCRVDICEQRQPLGTACDHVDACEVTAYCAGMSMDGEGICTELIEPGEPCSPADESACSPTAESYAWCNPASLSCQAPIPYVCSLFF